MKLTKHFASFLYFTVSFIMIVTVVYYIVAISAKFFGNDGQYINENGNGSLTIGNKNSEGTLVPVALTLKIPDSIKIDKSYFGMTSKETYPTTSNQYLKENQKIKARNVYAVLSMADNSSVIDANGNYINQKPNKFQFIKYVHSGDSQYLKIKTTSTFTNIILELRGCLNYLFYVLEMYFLALILKELAKEIYFSEVLSKYISKLGYLLLFSQLIPLIYTFIDLKLFGQIRVEPQILPSLQKTYFENIDVSFNPTTDFQIYIVLLGSILVLLTKLVERGRTLEEENEFTI